MLFTSIDFAFFFPIVFALFWISNHYSVRYRNFLVFVASYIFYGWWDWRFLSLIFLSTVVDYCIAVQLAREHKEKRRRWLLFLSVVINLGSLGFFKYFNFFLDTFNVAFSFFGSRISSSELSIVLPVGISFYTFQTLGYVIDVYRKRIPPTHDFIAFGAFVSFFPQLVAGPIERASHLLPQFYTKRKFEYGQSVDGMRQILWGFFKKIVVADSCAEYADLIFGNASAYSGSTLLLGSVFFAFQIYCDFSGYSDIAIGTARLLGIDLMRNFAFPYFSRDIAEFWRRWHISLTTWFRDYVYIPLGGSRGPLYLQVRNIFIVFILSGLWHGPKWTFVCWGVLNAIFYLPLLFVRSNRDHLDTVASGRLLPSIKELLLILLTFLQVCLGWIFFRADSLAQAVSYISRLFTKSLLTAPEIMPVNVVIILAFFLLVEWIGRAHEYGFQKIAVEFPKAIRLSIYCLLLAIIFYYSGKSQQFIYFQF